MNPPPIFGRNICFSKNHHQQEGWILAVPAPYPHLPTSHTSLIPPNRTKPREELGREGWGSPSIPQKPRVPAGLQCVL